MIAQPYLFIFLYALLTSSLGFNFWAIFRNSKLKLNLPLTLAISWGLGQGILSSVFFFLAFFHQLELVQVNVFMIALVLNLNASLFLALKKSALSREGWGWVVLTIGFFWPFFLHSLFAPLTSWDAVAIWFFKAKALFYSPGLPNTFFTRPEYWYIHPDYPLGLPLLITGFYRLLGQVQDQAPKFYLLLYYFHLSLLYVGAMNHFLKTKLNWLSEFLVFLFLLTIPNFLIYSLSGYADIPLSFVFALAFCLFLLGISAKQTSLLVLSGILGIMSAYLKIEGYPFMFLMLFIYYFWQKRKLAGMTWFLIFLSPIIIWEIVKIRIGIKGTFAEAHFSPHLLSNLKMILHTYLNELMDTSRYNLTLIVMFCIYLPILTQLIIKRLWAVLFLNLLPLGQLASYTLIYLLTPYPLAWQLTSFQRIVMHIIPLLFLLIFYNYHYLCKETKIHPKS